MRIRRFIVAAVAAGWAIVAMLGCGTVGAQASTAVALAGAAKGANATTGYTSANMSAAPAAPGLGSWYTLTPSSALTPLVPAAGPTNTTPPSISPSNPTVGTVLTADPGVWTMGNPPVTYDYQWESCDPSATCTDVGVDSLNYTVASGDIGNTLVVAVMATDTTGQSSPVTSGPTSVVPGVAANTAPPSISPSNPTVGTQLTANTGSWTNNPTSFDYQWQSCNPSAVCTNVGVDSQHYTVASGDIGNTLVVTVTANDTAGPSSPVTSGPTSVVPGVPANTAPPSISPSNPTVGTQLTANTGSWTNNPTSFDYQWQSCNPSAVCTNVGVDSQHYTVASGDIGNTLVVTVTANDTAGPSSPVTSGPTAVVPGPPANSVLPSITGTAAQGQTLSANSGTWSGSPTYSYQWESCNPSATCTNVGTNSATYLVASSDAGNTLVVVVTATNTAGSASATSAATSVVIGLPANTVLPVITGTAAQSQTLSASTGTWTNSPTSYSYQWKSCTAPATCTNVGTNSATYLVASSDVGHTLVVAVTATNAAGSPSATSTATAVVVGLPANTAVPSISGTAAVGQTLTASTGTWTNSPTSYSYQWQRCPRGSSCVDVNNTSQTYPVGQVDVNATLQVVVTATNAAGSVPSTSAPTALVPAVPGYPTAFFTESDLTPVPATGSPVTFTSTSTPYLPNSITGYSWNFGDGTSPGTGAQIVHTYSAAGRYAVTLTVTQSNGLAAQYQIFLTVDSPPTSAFSWNPSNPSPGTGLTFLDAASPGTGAITSYSWSFGDGGTSTAASPTHTYTAAGTYTVILTVMQSDGLSASVQHSVTVTGQTAGSNGTGGSKGSSGSAATKSWLAQAFASNHLPKIGALLKKNGMSSTLRAASASGHITITWYAVVRHRKIVIALGTTAVRAHAKARIAIKLTRTGHALLAKSRGLSITISNSFRSGAVHLTHLKKATLKR